MAVFISLLYLLYRVAGLIIISPCSSDHRGVFSFPDSFSPLFFNLENVHASSGSSSFSDRNNFLYLAHLSLSVSLFPRFSYFYALFRFQGSPRTRNTPWFIRETLRPQNPQKFYSLVSFPSFDETSLSVSAYQPESILSYAFSIVFTSNLLALFTFT